MDMKGSGMERVLAYIEERKGIFLNELAEFLSIPSISSQRDHREDTRRCAEWIAGHMRSIGMQHAKLFDTPGHPIVYGDWTGAPGKPTVLVYGHYDVQPVDPVNLWTSPPFEATIRGENLYARGAADDKGQVFIHLKAVEAYLRNEGRLPMNIKMLIEGEEEVGSVNLTDFLKEQGGLLKADFALISDSSMYRKGMPSVCYGLRGLTFLEMEVTGPNRDLHSGAYGGAIHNPIQALCELIASLHDTDGRITIPGFYEDVLPLTDEEKEAFERLPHSDEEFAANLGVRMLYGEKGFSTRERLWARPTLECNGIWGGYMGEGAKTVLPSKAFAKISMRLVPDQNPEKVTGLFMKHVREQAPKSIDIALRLLAGCDPVIVSIDSPWIRAIASALEKGFGTKPVFQREGGSIPIVAHIREILKLNPVMAGFGLPDENAHAPDEHMNLENFFAGIRTLIHFYCILSS